MYQHSNPVWFESANYLVCAPLDDDPTEQEQLWTCEVDTGIHVVCCIPFFLYDLSLGDTIQVDSENVFVNLVEYGGRWTFRAFLQDKAGVEETFLEKLANSDVLFERHGRRLFSIDAEDKSSAERVAAWLEAFEQRGIIDYEAGLNTVSMRPS